MLHLCNVLNVVRIGLDRYRTGHTREQDGRIVKRACANRMTAVCNGAIIRKSTLSQESPLTAVVPKPSEQQNCTTMCTKATEALISRVSCQVTVGVGVTGIDVSSTFNHRCCFFLCVFFSFSFLFVSSCVFIVFSSFFPVLKIWELITSFRCPWRRSPNLPGESNTWNMILNLSFHHLVGGILRDLSSWNGVTAKSETCCEFSSFFVPADR